MPETNLFTNEFQKNKEQSISDIRSFLRKAKDMQVVKSTTRIITTPPVLKEENRIELEYVLKKLLEIILTIPDRIFGGDLEQMGRFLGYQPKEIRKILDGTIRFEDKVLSRGDLYQTPDGWKLLELNLGSNVGGMTMAWLNRLMQETPFYNELIKSNDLKYFDPLIFWVNTIRGMLQINSNSLTLAMVESEKVLSSYSHTLQLMAKELQDHTGIQSFVCSQRDLEEGTDGLYFNGRKIDVVYRLFDLGDVEAAPEEYWHIFEALRAKRVQMPMGLEYKILGNKILFAMMSDHQYEPYFSNEELYIIHRYIPWTRLFEEKLISFALHNQRSLVIKPADGYGGIGVLCGWEHREEDWRNTLYSLLKRKEKYIIQEKVTPSTSEVYCSTPEGEIISQEVQLLWGAYLFDKRFAGGILRAKPIGGGSVINLHNGAAIGPIFIHG